MTLPGESSYSHVKEIWKSFDGVESRDEQDCHRPMKLLFVHQHLGAFGGAEANIQLSAAELRARGHQLSLLYQKPTGKGEEAWRDLFTSCTRIETNGGADSFRNILKRDNPDAIYLHTLPDVQVLRALVDSRVPVVRMVHDHALYCLRGYKYNVLSRKICTRPASAACIFPCLAPIARNHDGLFPIKWSSFSERLEQIRLNRLFDHFIVYSDYSRQELIRNGFDAAKISIHVPIESRGDAMAVSSFSDRNLILSAGQIIRGKGVDLLLRALTHVQAPFECLIFGDGNHRVHCERLCRRLGLSERVHFMGYVPRAELWQHYLDATVFAMSSVWPEPFGAVGLEAMRYGLPVVAFDAGGIKEWLIDRVNGFLVPHMDRAHFAARVEQLLRDKTLAREMGAKGAEMLRQKFDFTKYVDGLEAMFSRTIEEGRS